jgi:flavodoxin
MKIGIVVYSYTGQTLAAAETLAQKLSAAGHKVALKKIETSSEVKPGSAEATLKSPPDLVDFDAVVLAAPVWGGTPAPPMAIYLEQLPSLAGKQFAYLATGFFPPAMGCKQTIVKMKAACEAKGAASMGSGNISRLVFNRRQKTEKALADLAGLF